MIRAFLFLVFIPALAVAEPVTIRSGEHETFSRLVVAIGTETEWELKDAKSGYELVLSGRSDGFAISEVFERIPRSRLSDLVVSEPNVLQLDIDCHCYVDAFLWRPGQLVVDIVDGENPNESEGPSAITPTAELEFDARADTPSELPNLLSRSFETGDAATDLSARSNETQPTSEDIAAIEGALIESFARTASQGFLNPVVVELEPPNSGGAPDQSQPTAEVAPSKTPEAQRPGIGITSAMDRDLALLGEALGQGLERQCLSKDLFQIAAWADDRPFHEQAAVLVEALAGEFGEEPREAQDALARLYLHFGFGAEARLVLAADAATSQSRQVLRELAGLIDNYRGNYPLLEAQVGCETPAALWAFLASHSNLDTETRNHILKEFFMLPHPLRGQIAPRLARQFVEIDDPGSADRVLQAANNKDVDGTHDAQATRALVAEQLNDPDKALALLSEEADDNARTTPESLIRLIELAVERGQIPAESDLLLASAMRQEYRGDVISEHLQIAEAKGRIARGQYDLALDLVAHREDTAAILTRDHLFQTVTAKAEASFFLELAYGDIPSGLTVDTENTVARRLIDLGFPERARVFLSGPAEREAASERRYMKAEAALLSGNYAAVMDVLQGITDTRARELRARAHTALGEHQAALTALGVDGTASTNPTLQFRAGAWERLTNVGDSALSSFANTFLEPSDTVEAVTLADRREILTQSQESREAVEALLERFDGDIITE